MWNNFRAGSSNAVRVDEQELMSYNNLAMHAQAGHEY